MNFLLAQQVVMVRSSPSSIGIVAIVSVISGMALVFFLVLILWRNGWDEHAEPMRALELGFAPVPKASRWPYAIFCTMLGVGVPAASSLFAWPATSDLIRTGLQAGLESSIRGCWIGAAVVSILGILGSTITALVTYGRKERQTMSSDAYASTLKPAPGPESFEFVGRG